MRVYCATPRCATPRSDRILGLERQGERLRWPGNGWGLKSPVDIPQGVGVFLWLSHRRQAVSQNLSASKSEILQGTLDLMVLNTLATMGTLHGYGIARR